MAGRFEKGVVVERKSETMIFSLNLDQITKISCLNYAIKFNKLKMFS